MWAGHYWHSFAVKPGAMVIDPCTDGSEQKGRDATAFHAASRGGARCAHAHKVHITSVSAAKSFAVISEPPVRVQALKFRLGDLAAIGRQFLVEALVPPCPASGFEKARGAKGKGALIDELDMHCGFLSEFSREVNVRAAFPVWACIPGGKMQSRLRGHVNMPARGKRQGDKQ